MQDIQLQTIQPESIKIDIVDAQTLSVATNTLSILNSNLDLLTAHKEAKTKPINEALKKIRQDYKPLEDELKDSIQSLRQSITTYATNQAKIVLEREQKILKDKRTTTETKIEKLSNITQTPNKVNTEAGSISFITTKQYRVTNITQIPIEFMQPNDALIKQAMKESIPISGIEYYEEKSLRNYR